MVNISSKQNCWGSVQETSFCVLSPFISLLISSSVAQSCLILCCPMDYSTPGFPVHHQLPELAQIHVHQVGDAIQPSHPLSSPSPSAFSLSHIRVFSNESALCMRWPKYWSFSFSISPSSEHPGLISFRLDWLDLLAVQGTLKSLFQHHSSKALILWCSAFFTVLVLFNHKMEILCKILKMRWTNICEAFDTWPGL